jgi:hypothetical protein
MKIGLRAKENGLTFGGCARVAATIAQDNFMHMRYGFVSTIAEGKLPPLPKQIDVLCLIITPLYDSSHPKQIAHNVMLLMLH